MITIVAKIRAKKGHEAQVKAALLGFLAPSRAEAGCVNYDLHQASNDPQEFLFYENWKDQEAFDLHKAGPCVTHLQQELEGKLTESVEITQWTKLENKIGVQL